MFRAVWKSGWLGVAAVVILAVSVGAAVVAAMLWQQPVSVADHLTAAGVVAAIAALIVTAVAGFVAVAAYYQATRTPDLRLLIGRVGTPLASLPIAPGSPTIKPIVLEVGTGSSGLVQLRVLVSNFSKYSARNPAVRIWINPEVVDTSILQVAVPGPVGVWNLAMDRKSIQWEGGSDFAIHGTWQRELPLLELGTIIAAAGDQPSWFDCEVVAEGFRRDFVLDVQVVDVSPAGAPS